MWTRSSSLLLDFATNISAVGTSELIRFSSTSVSNHCPCRSQESSEDELDKLTREFEEQASKDLRQAAARKKKETTKVKTQKSMKEKREEGLQAPLSEQSKYELS